MLVLTRKVGEKIRIGEDIEIMVVRVDDTRVRLGISAPSDVAVRREELLLQPAIAHREAVEV